MTEYKYTEELYSSMQTSIKGSLGQRLLSLNLILSCYFCGHGLFLHFIIYLDIKHIQLMHVEMLRLKYFF
jgi:hypothetical protein